MMNGARNHRRVVLVEAAERLIPREDPGISTRILEALREDGVDVRVGVAADRVRPDDPGVWSR
jgi:NADH dehydrogenase FAD-containing subunit